MGKQSEQSGRQLVLVGLAAMTSTNQPEHQLMQAIRNISA